MMDDKELKDLVSAEDTDTAGHTGAETGDPTLTPGYKTPETQTATDTSKESEDITIEDILAEFGADTADVKSEGSAQKAREAPRLKPKRAPTGSTDTRKDEPTGEDANRAVTPPNTVPPGEEKETESQPPGDDKQVMAEMTVAMRELTEELRLFRQQMGGGAVQEGFAGANQPDKPNNKGEPKKEKSTMSKVLSVISNILFYVIIVGMVVGAFLMRSSSEGKPFMLAGFSAANVLTSSMEDVYPRGSLIITQSVDPKELKVGDDITFMVGEESSITHRIIGISENYQGSGERAFETKGVNNKTADKDMVVSANVVGKVIYCSVFLGKAATFVRANWPMILFVLIVVIALIAFLKWNAKRDVGEDEDKPPKEPKEKKKKERKARSHSKKNFGEQAKKGEDGDG